MSNLLDRSRIFKIQRTDETELDLLDNGWDDFNWVGETSKYVIIQADAQRPDLISLKKYGNDKYWWILMKFNNIEDIWNDLRSGKTLICPTKAEMDRFYLETTRREDLK